MKVQPKRPTMNCGDLFCLSGGTPEGAEFPMLIAEESPKRKGKEDTEGSSSEMQTGKSHASQFSGCV